MVYSSPRRFLTCKTLCACHLTSASNNVVASGPQHSPYSRKRIICRNCRLPFPVLNLAPDVPFATIEFMSTVLESSPSETIPLTPHVTPASSLASHSFNASSRPQTLHHSATSLSLTVGTTVVLDAHAIRPCRKNS